MRPSILLLALSLGLAPALALAQTPQTAPAAKPAPPPMAAPATPPVTKPICCLVGEVVQPVVNKVKTVATAIII